MNYWCWACIERVVPRQVILIPNFGPICGCITMSVHLYQQIHMMSTNAVNVDATWAVCVGY
jgi:hypothetical protein